MTTTGIELSVPTDEPVIRYRRFVKAPPELMFAMWTEPEHLRNWWGPRELELVLCEVDLRVGGSYRMVHRAPDGTEHAFRGEYLELDRPTKIVQTFVYEPWPDAVSVESVQFEETGDGTLVRGESRHSSLENRDRHVESGMESGMAESYARLDELVDPLRRD
jgi:uncharacterized protein YndB with AHSA1/START domain